MAGFTLVADIYTLDPNDASIVLEAFAKNELRKAMRAFLLACLARIPVRTGFLRGSFRDIERYFNVAGNYLVGTQPRFPEYYYVPGTNQRIIKTLTSGIPFTTPPDQVIKRQGDTFLFNLDVDINYFAINDFNQTVSGTPWDSIREGLAAFTTSLENSVNFYPDVEELFGTLSIRLSESNLTQSRRKADVSSRVLALRGFD